MKTLVLVIKSWLEWLSLPLKDPVPKNPLFWKNGWRVNFWHALSLSWTPLESRKILQAFREGFTSENTEEDSNGN